MKRILCLALVLVLLFQILVVPASAVDPLTGIIVTASAATVIGSALIGLGVLPGTDGSVFDGIVSAASEYLSSLGFGDGVGFPVLKYIGTGGGFRYALQSAAMIALRSWLFDEDVVVSSPGYYSYTATSSSGEEYIFQTSGLSKFYLGQFPDSSSGSNPYYSLVVFYPGADYGMNFTINGSSYSTSSASSSPPGRYAYFPNWRDRLSVPVYSVDYSDPSFNWSDFLNFISNVYSSDYDVSIGDVASPDTSLAVGYPNWAIDSVQVDPGNGDDPIPYVPIGLDDVNDALSQSQVQSGESSYETPNEGTEVTITGDVGGSLSPDGGGSGDLPGGEGSVTVDDLTTMFAWLAVRIDEAVQSLFPDLQVIKTYLKTIAQWHETENVKYDSMLSYFSGWDADIDTMLTTVSNIDLNLTSLVDHAAASSDTLAAIAADVQDIRDVIADPLDADINEEEQDNKNAFLNSFSKKSQAKSIGDLSGLSDGFTDWFSLDVDPGLLFDQVDTGFADWFTSETAQAISVGGGAAAAGISLMDDDPYVEPDTPYLDAWDLEVQDILSGGD